VCQLVAYYLGIYLVIQISTFVYFFGPSHRKNSPSPGSVQTRPSGPKPRRDIISPDTTGIELALPMSFNHIPSSSVIPQVQVPHDLTRLVSMLREKDDGGSSTAGGVSSSRSSPMSALGHPSSGAHQPPPSTHIRKQASTSSNLKRKKQHQNFQHCPTSSSHPVRRSLRPRAERSYAESPDIVVDYEDEPPSKINGVASTNGNGYGKDDDSDSDYGEMPPLPVIKVRSSLLSCSIYFSNVL